jgi:hypothetical protein
MLLISCEESPTPPAQSSIAETAPLHTVSDATMGNLSAVAIHIVAGLRDSAVRYRIHDMLLERGNYGIGIDLQDCGPGGRAFGVLHAAEAHGGQRSDIQCAALKKLRGAVLFMEPGRLAAWNPRVIPIVTAIADPDAPLPKHFLGYRSPDRTIELTDKGGVGGPLLVVLPVLHPSRPRSYSTRFPALKVTTGSPATGKRLVVP